MSNTINPYSASRSDLQRTVQSTELNEDGQRHTPKKVDVAQASPHANKGEADKVIGRDKAEQAANQDQTATANAGIQTSPRFSPALDGAIDESGALEPNNPTQPLEGLSPAEQQLIYRYFPESPSLELRLYKPDMSTDKVDPGSVGSRVDIRG